jgi:hypothetical protein
VTFVSFSRTSSGHRSLLIAMRAMIVAAIDQQPANAGRAHLGEGELLAEEGGGHRHRSVFESSKMRKCVPPEQTFSKVGHLAMFYREKSNASKIGWRSEQNKHPNRNQSVALAHLPKGGNWPEYAFPGVGSPDKPIVQRDDGLFSRQHKADAGACSTPIAKTTIGVSGSWRGIVASASSHVPILAQGSPSFADVQPIAIGSGRPFLGSAGGKWGRVLGRHVLQNMRARSIRSSLGLGIANLPAKPFPKIMFEMLSRNVGARRILL